LSRTTNRLGSSFGRRRERASNLRRTPTPRPKHGVGRYRRARALLTPDGHDDWIGTSFNGAFACDNVEKTYEELLARGVEFMSPPAKQPWGTFAVFKDPDGNQFVMGTR
jgi:hypothetical protein